MINTENDLVDFGKVTHAHNEPFSLSVDQAPLVCSRVLRLMPKKRLVAEGVWKEKPVVAKIFFKNGQRYLDRELQGYRLLVEANILTPDVLFSGQAGAVSLILFSKVSLPEKPSELVASAAVAQLQLLVLKLQSVVADLHRNNLIQSDAHPDNFIFSGDQVYTLDAASINREFDVDRRLDNLALFYAQLPIALNPYVLACFKEYCLALALDFDQLWDGFKGRLLKQRQKRANDFKVKSLRSSTAFKASKSLDKRYSCRREYLTSDLKAFIKSPQVYIQQNKVGLLKAGNTTTVFVIKLADKKFVVKRYNIKSLWHFVTHCWRKSRAEKSWMNANLLTLFGIATSKPVAFLEERFFTLRKTTYFLMEYNEGKELQLGFEQSFDEALGQAVLNLFAGLSALQISHGDCKSTNLFIVGTQVLLLDLDAMQMHKSKRRWLLSFEKDKRRFLKNWSTIPNVKHFFDVSWI